MDSESNQTSQKISPNGVTDKKDYNLHQFFKLNRIRIGIFAITIFFIGLILGGILFFGIGMKTCLDTGIKILEARGYDIDLTAREIVGLISIYRHGFSDFVEGNFTLEKTWRNQ